MQLQLFRMASLEHVHSTETVLDHRLLQRCREALKEENGDLEKEGSGAQHLSRIFSFKSFDTFFCPRTVLIGSGLAEEEGRSFHGETICRVS
jgi:hypothetical protein